MRHLTVVTAGLSTPSTTRQVADQIADSVTAAVSARGEAVEVHVIELKDLAVDLAQAMVSAGVPSPALTEAKRLISESDGLIAVTPVFKASYTGLFKMFFDVLDPKAIVGMPVVVAATAGSPRHSLVLEYAVRPMFAYLRATVMPTGVFAATGDFGTEAGRALSQRITQAAGELAEKMVTQRDSVGGLGGATARGQVEPEETLERAASRAEAKARRTGTDPEEEFTPFADLLAGHDGK